MGIIDKAIPIEEANSSNLWVIYGKSNSGKTHLLSTFPKPILYAKFGDDGQRTIQNVKGVDLIELTSIKDVVTLLEEARVDKKYKTVAVDTFSLLTQEWKDVNAHKKNKRMTQQMWGDILTETENAIKLAHILAKRKIVVLTCHEATDTIEGYEDEIMPDVRPSTTKGARTYLESMANFGIHTAVLAKEKEKDDGTSYMKYYHVAHLASNPYYWTKAQKPANIKLPKQVINPTYSKILSKIEGE